MKHLIRRVSSSKAKILAHFKAGDLTMNLTSRDGCLHVIMNGHEVFNVPVDEKNEPRLSHVLPDLFLDVIQRTKSAEAKVYKDKVSDVLEKSIVDNLVSEMKGPNPKALIIKRMPADKKPIQQSMMSEFRPEQALNYEHVCRNLVIFGRKMAHVCSLLSNAHEKAMMLTRKKLVETMWGAETTQSILDHIKEELTEEEGRWDKLDLYKEMIAKAIDRLRMKMQTHLFQQCSEEQIAAAEIIIPNIIEEYEKLKSLLTHAVVVLAPLVYIDEAFKENTTYPANFFMDGDLLEGLKTDYEGLIRFLSEIPNIEAKVIDPLDFLRVSFLNQK